MQIKEFYKKNKINEGNLIEFDFEKNTLKGTIIPTITNNLMIKLNTGYNAGFEISKIKNIKNLGKTKAVGKAKTTIIKNNPNLPTISLLHTGGTIASRVNYSSGGVIASFELEDLVTLFPELPKIANLNPVFVRNMMSEDMSFSDYQAMSDAIQREIEKGVKGIIIGHGTDTLGYSSAALSFMLENCPVPVLLVGSQRSSDRGSSDTGMNLICAAEFIAKTSFSGVAACMHHSTEDNYCSIISGTKVRKMHTSRRDAFKAINDIPIALVNYKNKEIKWLKDEKDFKAKGKLVVKDKFEKKVGLVKMYPNIDKKIIEFYRKEKYKGLIIEGTGLGQTPIGEKDSFVKEIEKLVNSGCIVGMTSQCINGRVNTTVYTNLRKVFETGVIYCEDMLPETAFVKLAWLLGNYSKKETEKLLAKNIVGEITDFSIVNTKLTID
jgi:glutamyl-tRNA(Gln) amidotransferase subunit D